MIYFIQQGSDGPIKIGRSDDVEKRLADLQVSNPWPLHIRRVITEQILTETDVHFYFRDARLKGEWFKPSDEILAFIEGFQSEQELASLIAAQHKLAERSCWGVINVCGTDKQKSEYRAFKNGLHLIADRIRNETHVSILMAPGRTVEASDSERVQRAMERLGELAQHLVEHASILPILVD